MGFSDDCELKYQGSIKRLTDAFIKMGLSDPEKTNFDPTTIDFSTIRSHKDFSDNLSFGKRILKTELNIPQDNEMSDEFFIKNWFWNPKSYPLISKKERLKKKLEEGEKEYHSISTEKMFMSKSGIDASRARMLATSEKVHALAKDSLVK